MIGFLIFDFGFSISKLFEKKLEQKSPPDCTPDSNNLGLGLFQRLAIANCKSEIENLSDAVLELSQQADRRIWWPFVGTSMSPYIKEGDMLLVQHTLHPIRLGDVIVFRRAGGLIAHRVILIRRHGNSRIYQTKGDNTRSFDVPILQSSVLGRVVRIQKSNRSISLEKPYIKLFNFVFALSSYAMGILCKFAIFNYRFLISRIANVSKEDA